MTTEEKLDNILSTLTGFIAKQEAFNSKQEAFNSKQEAFNSKQEAFNSKQEGVNSRLEMSVDNLRRDMAEFRHQEELQHNATHRLIMQAFEHIAEIK
jgi:hypothetical protein